MRLNFGDIFVEISKTNIHIHNSYKLTSKTDKQAMLNEIFSIMPKFPRSYKSALRE